MIDSGRPRKAPKIKISDARGIFNPTKALSSDWIARGNQPRGVSQTQRAILFALGRMARQEVSSVNNPNRQPSQPSLARAYFLLCHISFTTPNTYPNPRSNAAKDT